MGLEAIVDVSETKLKSLGNESLAFALGGKTYLNGNIFGFSIIDGSIFCVDDKGEKLSFYNIPDEVRNINNRGFNFWLNPNRPGEKFFPYFTTQTIIIDGEQWMYVYGGENNDSFVTDGKMIYLKGTYNYTLVTSNITKKGKK